MWQDIEVHVRSCDQCQRRSTRKIEVPLTPSIPSTIFTKIHVDLMDMPESRGYKSIITARDELTQAAEGRALKNKKAKTVARFFWTQIICRYGAIAQVVTDNGHFIIREAILKSCEGDPKRWPDKVHHAFFADKCLARRATGFSPFYLLHGVDPVLPFDLAEATFLVEGFRQEMPTAQLLALRIRQLEKRPEDIQKAAMSITKSRFQAKWRWEKHFARRFLPEGTIQPGTLVLVRNTRIEKHLNKKQYPRYSGPYEVYRQTKQGSYVLKELDGTIDRRAKAAFRIMPYIQRRPRLPGQKKHREAQPDIDFSDWELDEISDDEDDLDIIHQAEMEAKSINKTKKQSRVGHGRRHRKHSDSTDTSEGEESL
ncbi:hypothetical protein PUNSTDRAFT_78221 [Punctularia strigosozonata HHB-11173 SS5]|uniref:Integrase catalytic domain-containing protein n=1 Tax=Punctularia strigosozonata (strain HHB-11173) TaxID=741275 RepID=R7S0S7_PUNST|nr:uncharacterized protein PUNSTDRAFT_78221 [Punctularia strigosozonata HHB-11173 SS5]EIN03402.1 hypothetical protein PUNSTDRAFT_78221 [Punctularia strigosozonata HHB-11173 SS5]